MVMFSYFAMNSLFEGLWLFPLDVPFGKREKRVYSNIWVSEATQHRPKVWVRTQTATRAYALVGLSLC